MVRSILILTFLLIADFALASEFVVSGITMGELKDHLASQGMSDFDDNEDDGGVLWLRGKTPEGLIFVANFYDCANGHGDRRCNRVQLISQWSAKANDLLAANAYNGRSVFGRVYLSKDGKYLTHDYSFDVGAGVREENVLRNIEVWHKSLREFSALKGNAAMSQEVRNPSEPTQGYVYCVQYNRKTVYLSKVFGATLFGGFLSSRDRKFYETAFADYLDSNGFDMDNIDVSCQTTEDLQEAVAARLKEKRRWADLKPLFGAEPTKVVDAQWPKDEYR